VKGAFAEAPSQHARPAGATAVKSVLIAHQSTIPHYRVDFYRRVEGLRPSWWEFSVVYSAAESRRQRFRTVELQSLPFPTVRTRGVSLYLGRRRLVIQDFPLRAASYDLLVVGDELRNLSYPLSHLWALAGKPVARWGHGRDTEAASAGVAKRAAEASKRWLQRRASGFFAYTPRVREELVAHGVDRARTFVLDNTIDIETERQRFLRRAGSRLELRRRIGAVDGRILVFVGRATMGRRMDFLAEAFTRLRQRRRDYRLLVVGEGHRRWLERMRETGRGDGIEARGSLDEEALADVLTAGDLYVAPGLVGLGPLQALCYDLIPVVVDLPEQKPEYEYLSAANAVICPPASTPEDYARAIDDELSGLDALERRRRQAWPSIRHLTIDRMAENFIRGVSRLLGGPRA